jgi:hypothetical protein
MTAVGTDYKVGNKVTSPWLPNGGTITQGFGTQEFLPQFGINAPHEGIDIGANRGDPLITPDSATVTGAGWDAFGGGNFVHLKLLSGEDIQLYHLQDIVVKTGQVLSPNSLLGHIDSTGDSTGDHLHFQVNQSGKPIDPWTWLTQIGSGGGATGGIQNPFDAIKNVNDFFGHLVAPSHGPCSPAADESGVFKIIDAFTCPQNWWKALFVTIGITMIGAGVFIYFFKEEKGVVVNVVKTAEVAEAAA